MKALRIALVALVVLAVGLVASADAQTLLFVLDTPNPQAGAAFGASLAVGDVNGDGKGDVAVGAPHEQVNGNQRQGRVYVFNGRSGSVLLTLDTPKPQADAGFGSLVAVGDVNGDGWADVAATGGDKDLGTVVYVFSGADGSLLLSLHSPGAGGFGSSVALGDVNGDGNGDIAVGASHEDPGPGVYVFSGADGSLLFALDGLDTRFGVSVAVGEVNGDGKADIAVGLPGPDRAYVFSGADRSLLLTLTGCPHGGAFGASIAVGEVNGDAKADIAVGDLGSGYFNHVACVFSGADGSLLMTLHSTNPQLNDWFGSPVAVGDVTGDGKGEIAVGAGGEWVGGTWDVGRAYVFSGGDGSLLLTLDTPNPQVSSGFGGSLAMGDGKADHRADIVAAATGEDVDGHDDQGRAYVFSAAGPVGGVAQLPNVSGSSDPNYLAVAGLAAALLVTLTAAAWYARRRFSRG